MSRKFVNKKIKCAVFSMKLDNAGDLLWGALEELC